MVADEIKAKLEAIKVQQKELRNQLKLVQAGQYKFERFVPEIDEWYFFIDTRYNISRTFHANLHTDINNINNLNTYRTKANAQFEADRNALRIDMIKFCERVNNRHINDYPTKFIALHSSCNLATNEYFIVFSNNISELRPNFWLINPSDKAGFKKLFQDRINQLKFAL